MRTIITLLIACSLNFTASSQIDSLTCFTPDQIKTILRTKVELNNCLEQFNVVLSDLSVCETLSIELTDENTKLTVKVKRRGRVIGGTVIGGLILGAVAVLK